MSFLVMLCTNVAGFAAKLQLYYTVMSNDNSVKTTMQSALHFISVLLVSQQFKNRILTRQFEFWIQILLLTVGMIDCQQV
jgi:hypothetical protein